MALHHFYSPFFIFTLLLRALTLDPSLPSLSYPDHRCLTSLLCPPDVLYPSLRLIPSHFYLAHFYFSVNSIQHVVVMLSVVGEICTRNLVIKLQCWASLWGPTFLGTTKSRLLLKLLRLSLVSYLGPDAILHPNNFLHYTKLRFVPVSNMALMHSLVTLDAIQKRAIELIGDPVLTNLEPFLHFPYAIRPWCLFS